MSAAPSLRQGDQGPAVQALQQALATQGFALVASGTFDTTTLAAVQAFQQRAGLPADGLAGPRTLAALGGAADPRQLAPADLQNAATTLAVPLAAVQAVTEAESRGSGFLDDGRPVILFERHVFYARLVERRGRATAELLARDYPNLVNPQPGGYGNGTSEWQRLTLARQLDENLALESASWGLFQIMGYHWQTLDYADIQDFVARMTSSAAAQLEAFVRFLRAQPGLLQSLRTGKWADFARGYNGPGYARNLYDIKLSRAFARYQAESAR
ncbi:peptidoglycan-binding protein [Pseudomonas oryzihabitans]|nr:peptidoglycan-binding protein [Pseudomonas psychrotolerans]